MVDCHIIRRHLNKLIWLMEGADKWGMNADCRKFLGDITSLFIGEK